MDTHFLKLENLQNRLIRAFGNLDPEFHVAFKILYVYDYITKLCRTQAELILNHVHGIGQGEARHRKL
jgi:hypothetical protein